MIIISDKYIINENYKDLILYKIYNARKGKEDEEFKETEMEIEPMRVEKLNYASEEFPLHNLVFEKQIKKEPVEIITITREICSVSKRYTSLDKVRDLSLNSLIYYSSILDDLVFRFNNSIDPFVKICLETDINNYIKRLFNFK